MNNETTNDINFKTYSLKGGTTGNECHTFQANANDTEDVLWSALETVGYTISEYKEIDNGQMHLELV